MTPAEIARAMGSYIREHGFSEQYNAGDGCGCFMHAAHQSGVPWVEEARWRFVEPVATVLKVIGADGYGVWALQAAGWAGRKATKDAAAACDIAADLLS